MISLFTWVIYRFQSFIYRTFSHFGIPKPTNQLQPSIAKDWDPQTASSATLKTTRCSKPALSSKNPTASDRPSVDPWVVTPNFKGGGALTCNETA